MEKCSCYIYSVCYFQSIYGICCDCTTQVIKVFNIFDGVVSYFKGYQIVIITYFFLAFLPFSQLGQTLNFLFQKLVFFRLIYVCGSQITTSSANTTEFNSLSISLSFVQIHLIYFEQLERATFNKNELNNPIILSMQYYK